MSRWIFVTAMIAIVAASCDSGHPRQASGCPDTGTGAAHVVASDDCIKQLFRPDVLVVPAGLRGRQSPWDIDWTGGVSVSTGLTASKSGDTAAVIIFRATHLDDGSQDPADDVVVNGGLNRDEEIGSVSVKFDGGPGSRRAHWVLGGIAYQLNVVGASTSEAATDASLETLLHELIDTKT